MTIPFVHLEHTPRDTQGPCNVPVPRPRLSWATTSEVPSWYQSRAEIAWTTGGHTQVCSVSGSDSVLIDWPFDPLLPRQEGTIAVRVEGQDGWSEWSAPCSVFASFLAEGEWQAQFIALPSPVRRAQPLMVRKEFDVGESLVRATLYSTAHGVYATEVNGTATDDQVLKPGWTPYQRRLIHATTDITAALREGPNVIGAMLAGGWYCQSFGFHGRDKPLYGDQPSFAAQVALEYADGSLTWVCTGEDWKVNGYGPVVDASNYAGETYDARRLPGGWSSPGFDDSAWVSAVIGNPGPIPEARTSPEARAVERVNVAAVSTSPTGKTLLDFGQNLVGRLRIRVSGPEGTTVTLRHAEVLEDGELGVRPLRAADATDRYTLAGGGVQEWAPQFTFHGFRYAEVTGWPGEVDPGDVIAEVVSSDMARTGWFECSDEQVNRLHDNVVWSMRGNFLYLPTDCPQRDERLGWTGDIQVFGPSATYLFDSHDFLASWLKDLGLEQDRLGGVPFVVPDVLDSAHTPVTGWGDVTVLLPWVLYQRFGDKQILTRQYASGKAWVDEILALGGKRHLWEGDFQFGDWVDPDSPADRPGKSKVDPDLVSSAYLYHSTHILSQIADLIGAHEDGAYYREQAEAVRAAWVSQYVTPAGRIVSDAQTAYALAIAFHLVDGDTARLMGDRLAWLCRRDGYRIGTGFLGTPVICDALTDTGHLGEAARMLLQRLCPSWLYPVTMGATTIWERWDSMLEDGSINPGEMTSFNHYALGAIADWMHRVVAGLGSMTPGYRRLLIAPRPITGLDWASSSHDTPYGKASVTWRRKAEQVVVEAVVPANTTADVRLPDGRCFEVGAGSHVWQASMPAAPVPGEVSTANSLAEIIDDPQAFQAMIEVFEAAERGSANRFVRRVDWVEGRTLSQGLNQLGQAPANVDAQIVQALGRLSEARQAPVVPPREA